MKSLDVVALVGSLRAKSVNRAAVEAAVQVAPDDLRIEIAEIGALPLYNDDLDVSTGPIAELYERVKRADGLLIATPEFNYGIPGPLKNAIDWISRPAYRSPLAGKPVALFGATPSGVGTARAQGQLKQVLLGTVSDVFPYPEVLIAGAHQRFDADLQLTDDKTREVLARFMTAYAQWLRARVAG